MNYIPYVITFVAGAGFAHAFRSKQITPESRRTPGVAGDDKSMKTMMLDAGAHVM